MTNFLTLITDDLEKFVKDYCGSFPGMEGGVCGEATNNSGEVVWIRINIIYLGDNIVLYNFTVNGQFVDVRISRRVPTKREFDSCNRQFLLADPGLFSNIEQLITDDISLFLSNF